MKQYPKVFSKEGQEELGKLVAKQKAFFTNLELYINELEHGYVLHQVEYGKLPSTIFNYLLGSLLSIIPMENIKKIGKELKSDKYAKRNITLGETVTDYYQKSKYDYKTAIQHYIESENARSKNVNLKLIK